MRVPCALPTFPIARAPARAPEPAPAELDLALVESCQSGDPDALRRFVVRYQPVVFGFLSRSLGHGAHVEDLAQEVFLRAIRALPRYRGEGQARISTWLLTIAARIAIDARRRKRIEPFRPEEAGAAIDPATPETERQQRALALALRDALTELSPEQRDAYVLAELQGLCMADLAQVLGVPEGAAKARLFRARERLRQILAPLWKEGW